MTTEGTPQTQTTMEACVKLAAGSEDAVWKAQEYMGPVVAQQPGFVAVIGGPIANSRWIYFCGKFETPALMDHWYQSEHHEPVIRQAYEEWFEAVYIRKWRLPGSGETLTGPLFLETLIVPTRRIEETVVADLLPKLARDLDRFGALPFETLVGKFEKQPFQFIGPLEEFPQPAPVRYLMLTHWENDSDLSAWLESPEARSLAALGEVSTTFHVQIRHEAGERDHLTADGTQRGWERAAG